jgi:uncharacterized membrane protein YqjE
MEDEKEKFFPELKLLVSDYVEARLKLIKFEVYEKSAKISAMLFSSLVIAMLASMILFFLSIALGFYLGSVLDSYGTGFMIVTGFYILLLLPFIFFRKNWIEKSIINRVIERLMEKEEDEK